MSWNIDVPVATPDQFPQAAAAALAAALSQHGHPVNATENTDQVDQAIAAASAVVASGAVGTGPIRAYLSGHANHGHKPRHSYSNDFLSIRLESVEEHAPAE